MTRFVLFLIFACISLGGNAWADEVKEGCVTVQRSDNLTRVARALNSTVSNLVVVNGIKNQDRIYPGQKICREVDVKVPAMDSKPLQQKKPAEPAPRNSETGVASNIPAGYTPYAETCLLYTSPRQRRASRGGGGAQCSHRRTPQEKRRGNYDGVIKIFYL